MHRLISVVAAILAIVLPAAGCTSDPAGTGERGGRSASGSSSPTEVAAPVSWRSGGGPAGRPNIVLITTDDQTLVDLRWMPRTRRLVGGAGIRFTNFLSNHPSCCPARAEILTGQYAQNNHVLTNGGRWGGYDRFEPATALPVWLERAGYRTGLVGKYLNLYDETDGPQPGWTRWSATVDGLYSYRGFTQYDGERLTEPAGHQTTYIQNWSTDFIAEQAAGDRPFFLWSSYVAPHSICEPGQEEACAEPPMPLERDRHLYGDVRPTFLDDPGWGRPIQGDVRPAIRGDELRPERAEQTRMFRDRLRSLAAVDRAVARTVDALRLAGVLDDTVLMFTSDNGFMFGEHQLVGKDVPYEQAVHVPLLVRGPGIEPRVARTPAAMVDLAPTIAELARARPLVPVDGRSLVHTLGRGDSGADRTILLQGGVTGHDPQNRTWAYRGVRTQRYTYARWFKNSGVELFDRLRDPHEVRNLARDPAYRRIRRELARRAELLGGCTGSSCRVRFDALPTPHGE